MNPQLDRIPGSVIQVLRRLRQSGYSAFLVGGCVRDLLLEHSIHDFDIATNARPDAVAALFSRTIPTGLRHGTVTVLMNDLSLEVTTFRRESSYSDARRPDSVTFADTIEEDLARRDFTFNAMAMNVDGHLIDPFGGQVDLQRACIRAVGNPAKRFAEDGLRIFRALRFAADLGFAIAPDSFDAMTKSAHLVSRVAYERIGQELARIAGSRYWPQIVAMLARGPWLTQLKSPWPELAIGFRELAEAGIEPVAAAVRTLAKTLDPALQQATTAAVWANRANIRLEHVRQWLRTMAWSRPVRDAVIDSLACYAVEPLGLSALEWRKFLFDKDPNLVFASCLWKDVLDPTPNTLGLRLDPPSRVERYVNFAETQPLWTAKNLAINGRDLLYLGASGKAIGDTLGRLVSEVLAGRIQNTHAHLREHARAMLKEM